MIDGYAFTDRCNTEIIESKPGDLVFFHDLITFTNFIANI